MAKRKNSVSRRKKHNNSKKKVNLVNLLKLNKIWILYLTILLIVAVGGSLYAIRPDMLEAQPPPPPANALYKQANQPTDARVADLMSRMTLDEKIGQMALVDKNSLKKKEDISKYYLGAVLSGAGAKPETNTPEGWLNFVNEMKNQSSSSRLAIPIFYGIDANHGHSNVLGATVFPHAIGLGASRNNNLVKSVAGVTADELKATGINWSFSPSLDAPKDIRWGRVYEAFSDDPQLNGTLGSMYVQGTQKLSGVKGDKTYVLASAKHYLGTGSMNWGQSNHKKFKIDQGKISPDENKLQTEYLPPFKAAVDTGVGSVMVGLNQWGNERIIDGKFLITEKLKNELGFKGFVVSDWYGVYEYSRTSKYQANVKAINAGLDMAMLPYDYKAFLKDVRKAVEEGEISQTRIDDAVSRILYQKIKAGLFDTSSKIKSIDIAEVGGVEHRSIARQAVAESAVLLKNSASVLPLPKENIHILVAGTGADNVGRQSGAWTAEWQGVDGNWMPGGTSILSGMLEAAGSGNRIEYKLDGKFGALDKKADVGIAIISEKPYAEGWGDNPVPSIDSEDLQAIESLKQNSNKVIVIMLSGRPLLITDKISDWDAAVAAWLPGSEGRGVADVIFGDKPFTGKLPITWPANIGQLPISAYGTTSDGSDPLFARNFGL